MTDDTCIDCYFPSYSYSPLVYIKGVNEYKVAKTAYKQKWQQGKVNVATSVVPVSIFGTPVATSNKPIASIATASAVRSPRQCQ